MKAKKREVDTVRTYLIASCYQRVLPSATFLYNNHPKTTRDQRS